MRLSSTPSVSGRKVPPRSAEIEFNPGASEAQKPVRDACVRGIDALTASCANIQSDVAPHVTERSPSFSTIPELASDELLRFSGGLTGFELELAPGPLLPHPGMQALGGSPSISTRAPVYLRWLGAPLKSTRCSTDQADILFEYGDH
jgi:hypothetical protein